MRALVTAIGLLWCLGMLASEGVSQGAAALALLVLLLRWKRQRPPEHLRPIFKAALMLALWQGVSPLIARFSGVAAGWPRSGRWTQALDTLAPFTWAGLVSIGLFWWLIGLVLLVGWLLSAGVGVYQHRFYWKHGLFPWSKTPGWRLHQNFGTPEARRYAATGFLFHRLRFAHAAVAMLGPALALVLWGRKRGKASAGEDLDPSEGKGTEAATLQAVSGEGPKRFAKLQARSGSLREHWGVELMLRGLVGLLVLALLIITWTSFARAAFLAAVLVCVVAVFARGARRGALTAVLLIPALFFAAQLSAHYLPETAAAWPERILSGFENLTSGDRTVAMRAGLSLALDHPFLGVGFGNHQSAALALVQDPQLTPLLAHDSHNLWLTFWAETGLLGLFLALRLHGLLCLSLYRRWKQGAWLAGGALLSFLGFHLLGLVHYLPFHSSVALSFAFIWGLGLGAHLPNARAEKGAQAEAGALGGDLERAV